MVWAVDDHAGQNYGLATNDVRAKFDTKHIHLVQHLTQVRFWHCFPHLLALNIPEQRLGNRPSYKNTQRRVRNKRLYLDSRKSKAKILELYVPLVPQIQFFLYEINLQKCHPVWGTCHPVGVE